MIDLKYPILFVHGMGFRDGKICYWGRIPKVLKQQGCTVFFGEQDSNGSIADNAVFLAERIKEIVRDNHIEKLNIIAHSKGGLDIRYAICHLGIGDHVASLTTISTPHNGSYTVDKLMKLPKTMIRLAAACSDLWLRILGDKHPNAYDVFLSFTTEYAKRFNEENPMLDNIYYQSYAFVCKTYFSDIFMWFPHLVISLIEGENDGLLTPRAVQYGNFRGIYTGNTNRGISHCDEVDMRRFRFTRKQGDGISDMVEFYMEVVEELAEKGF